MKMVEISRNKLFSNELRKFRERDSLKIWKPYEHLGPKHLITISGKQGNVILTLLGPRCANRIRMTDIFSQSVGHTL